MDLAVQPNFAKKKHTGGVRGHPKVNKLLKDYRWVWNNPAEKDQTDSHKELRKIKVENPKAFLKQLNDMERSRAIEKGKSRDGQVGVIKGKGDEPPPAVVDLGTEKVLALAEELIREAVEASKK